MRFIKYIFVVLIIVIISVFLFDEKEDLSFERPIPIKFSEKF